MSDIKRSSTSARAYDHQLTAIPLRETRKEERQQRKAIPVKSAPKQTTQSVLKKQK